jgi:hypothetical protein
VLDLKEDFEIHNEAEALAILEDAHQSTSHREIAARFLETNASGDAIENLVSMINDDDFGVRWSASTALARMGDQAIPFVLKAIMRNYNARLRESVYHILHYNQGHWTQWNSRPLMDALRSLAPDITAPKAAFEILAKYNRSHDTSVDSGREGKGAPA